MIFANWRGFSGGTRDMYAEVLKFGAMIVDALVEYRHPVFIYIPPHGELRGGSWVVIDPAINPAVMEMYADEEARGGILEPAGIVEVKFREAQRVELMHRLDEQLQKLDNELKKAKPDAAKGIQTRIKAREEQLQGLYTQVACEFADLHDRTGRMKAKGAIREGLQWRNSRAFFHWRVRRRLAEERVLGEIMKADPKMQRPKAEATLTSWLPKGNEQDVALFLERGAPTASLKALRRAHVRQQIAALQAELDDADGNVSSQEVENDRPGRGPCFGATRLFSGRGRTSKPHNAQHPKACGDTAPP
jgi:acetyl-CoA carboxylase/biotin carboxylase 1